MPWSTCLLSEPDLRVAYTDADTIKAKKKKLEGVLSQLKPKWVGYDAEQSQRC
jgi:hypothetical protein